MTSLAMSPKPHRVFHDASLQRICDVSRAGPLDWHFHPELFLTRYMQSLDAYQARLALSCWQWQIQRRYKPLMSFYQARASRSDLSTKTFVS